MRTHPVLSLALALSALICWNGCISSRVIVSSRVPEITIDESGSIIFKKEPIKLSQIANAVKSAGITREQEVKILVPDTYDLSLRRAISSELLRHGYTRTVFIKTRKASAGVPGQK